MSEKELLIAFTFTIFLVNNILSALTSGWAAYGIGKEVSLFLQRDICGCRLKSLVNASWFTTTGNNRFSLLGHITPQAQVLLFLVLHKRPLTALFVIFMTVICIMTFLYCSMFSKKDQLTWIYSDHYVGIKVIWKYWSCTTVIQNIASTDILCLFWYVL